MTRAKRVGPQVIATVVNGKWVPVRQMTRTETFFAVIAAPPGTLIAEYEGDRPVRFPRLTAAVRVLILGRKSWRVEADGADVARP